MSTLILRDGSFMPLNDADLDYWDWHPLPYGAYISGDFRHLKFSNATPQATNAAREQAADQRPEKRACRAPR